MNKLESAACSTSLTFFGNTFSSHFFFKNGNDFPFYVNFLFVLKTLDKWSPALQIRTVLLSIQALLSAPNPDDPLANDVAELWKVNEGEAIRNAREWTRTYAMGNI